MGHLVNPISFRLGRKQSWKSEWFILGNNNYILTLKDDFLFYKFFEGFFKSIKNVKRAHRSLIHFRFRKLQFSKIKIARSRAYSIKAKFFSNLRKYQIKYYENYFRVRKLVSSKFIEKLSLIFSHVNIARNGKRLSFDLYVYDASLWRRLDLKKRKSYFKSLSFFRKIILHEALKFRTKGFFFDKLFLFNLKILNLSYLLKIKNIFWNKFNLINKIKIKKINYYNLFKFLWLLCQRKLTTKFQNIFLIRILLYLSIFLKFEIKIKIKLIILKLKKKTNLNYLKDKENIRYFFKKLKKKKILNKLNYWKKKNNWINYNYIKKFNKYKYDKKRWNKRIRPSLFTLVLKKNKKKIKLKTYNRLFRKYNFLKNDSELNENVSNNNKVLLLKHKWKIRLKKKNYIKILKKIILFLRKTYIRINLFSLFLLNNISKNLLITSFFFNLRYKLWFYISNILHVNIHSILNLNKKKNKELNIISFKYFALNNKSVTSNMVVSYIITKLLQKYTFFETIRPISKELGFNTTLDGFKIKCSGRLTKTERASVSMQQFKRVSLSTVDAKIDYAFDYVRLKNSVCGIKVWISRTDNYIPYAYLFKFSYIKIKQ